METGAERREIERLSLSLPPWENGINRVPCYALPVPSVFYHKLLSLFLDQDPKPFILMIQSERADNGVAHPLQK